MQPMTTCATPEQTAATLVAQRNSAKGTQPLMKCADCPRESPLRYLYKCWFCKLWFCGQCAPIHFGDRRA